MEATVNSVDMASSVLARQEATLEGPARERPQTESPNKFKNLGRKVLFAALAVAGLCVISVFGYRFYQHVSTHEETDDSYVTGHLHQVSTRINGTVQEVLVDDNDHVKAGQLLVALDPRDYKVRLDQAIADLSASERQAHVADTSIKLASTNAQGQDRSAQGGIKNAIATIARSEAAVREAQSAIATSQANLLARDAELERAQTDWNRYAVLETKGAVTTSSRDSAKRDFLVAKENRHAAQQAVTQAVAQLDQAKDSVNTAKAQLIQAEGQMQLAQASSIQTTVNKGQFKTTLASVEKSKAALEEAELNLSYTKITSPTTGRVGKKSVEVGQRIEPGQPLMTVVADDLWVVANFKETQLKKMHAGQEVEMTIDSFPSHVFRGTLQSFSPGSGSSFAVLPSDNATGNFVKIVQRIPVKVIFDKATVKGYEDRMAPGMSVITSVAVGP